MKKAHETIVVSALGGAAITSGCLILLDGLFLWSWSRHMFTLVGPAPGLIAVICCPLLFVGLGALILRGLWQRSAE